MNYQQLKKSIIDKLDAGTRFKLIPVDVYKFPLSDCTNGGISSKHSTLYMPCDEGHVNRDDVERDSIVIPEQRSAEYWALNPLNTPAGSVGPMSGGNLAYSSDSRVRRVYHIHDRFETQKQYDTLST